MNIQVPPFRQKSLGHTQDPIVPTSAITINNIDGTATNSVLFAPNAAIDTIQDNLSWSISLWILVDAVPADENPAIFWSRTNSTFTNDDAQYILLVGADNTNMVGECSLTRDNGTSLGANLEDLDASSWSSIVIQVSAAEMNIWQDNVIVGTASPITTLKITPTSFFAFFFSGLTDPLTVSGSVSIADFRFYSSTLTPTEIEDIANKEDVTTNLVARLKFNNNCNDSVGDLDGTAGSGVSYTQGPPGLPA